MRELQKMIRHLDNGAHAPIETDVNQLLGGRTSTEYATALLGIGIRAQAYVIVMKDTLELPDTLLAIRRVKGTNVRKTVLPFSYATLFNLVWVPTARRTTLAPLGYVFDY